MLTIWGRESCFTVIVPWLSRYLLVEDLVNCKAIHIASHKHWGMLSKLRILIDSVRFHVLIFMEVVLGSNRASRMIVNFSILEGVKLKGKSKHEAGLETCF